MVVAVDVQALGQMLRGYQSGTVVIGQGATVAADGNACSGAAGDSMADRAGNTACSGDCLIDR